MCLIIGAFLLTGCTTFSFDKTEKIPELLEKANTLTQNAIQQKDIEKVRDIWSQISELGIKLEENGQSEIALQVNQLAATYIHLIDYLKTGNNDSYKQFNTGYLEALDSLKEALPDFLKTLDS